MARARRAAAFRIATAFCAATLVFGHPKVFGGEVSARLDPTAVTYGVPVTLVLDIEGETTAAPDLSVLASDFDIVDRRSQRSLSIVNGRRSARYQLTLTLAPRRAGELEVPSIPVGETATRPLRLSVEEGGTDSAPIGPQARPVLPMQQPATAKASVPTTSPRQDGVNEDGDQTPTAAMEVSVAPSRVRVGEQFVLTARVYTRDSVMRSQLRDPHIPHANVLPLGEDRYHAPWDGERRSVYERRYAIFPVAAGNLKIEPLVFEGWALGDDTQASGFPPRERPIRTASQTIDIEVLPAASGKEGADWLPARSLSLTESGPNTYQVRAGQPLERRISLRADGLMSRALPAPTIDVPYQLSLSRRQPRLWDERRPQGVIGTRQEVITLTAHEPGHYRLPPLRLEWWNTGTDRWETAILPARELVVTPSGFAEPETKTSVSSERWTAVVPAERWPTYDATETPGALSAQPADPEPARSQATSPRRGDIDAGGTDLWTWLALAFALAWLATTGAWWRNRRRPRPYEPVPAPPEPERVEEPQDPLTEAIANVRSAYEADDAPGARNALLAWGAQVLPDSPPSNLARLAQRCPEPLREQILMLEQAFFSPRPLPWERQRVWEQMRHFEPVPADEPASFRRAKPLRRRTAGADVS